MALTIGIDARAAVEVPAGRGRVVRELLRALERRGDGHRWLLYGRERWDGTGFEQRPIASPDPLWHLRAARAASRECDAFLSTNSYLTSWFTRVPTAVVVYDFVAWVPGAQPQRRAALIERATIRVGVRRAAALLCISDATRRDLVERFPRAAPKAEVVPLAADARFAEPVRAQRIDDVRRRHGLTRPFVLTTGTLEPRKNLRRLIAAFAALPDELRTAHQLAIAGPRGWEFDAILRDAALHADEVRVLGYVDEEDLPALYAGCTAFAYPSLYEGFGLPVLEAMSAGAACVTSDASSLPEVTGDAALLVDPRDVGAIRDALARLLASPEDRASLGARARERARAFSWDDVADRVAAALAQAASSRS
jgi:glycosyltransferase involved in cell wall biosynthesis